MLDAATSGVTRSRDPTARARRVIVVGGEALVDLVEGGGVLRAVPGGGPFNTAIALGRLDVPVAFLGTLSRDGYGSMLERALVEAGVEVSLVRRSGAPTPRAVVGRNGAGENTYTFSLAGTAFTDLPPDALPALPAHASAIHVGTLALGVDPPAAAFESLLEREAGRRTIVLDPNVRPDVFGEQAPYRARFERLAELAAVVKLSDYDASWIYPGLEPAAVLERILGRGPRLVAVTLGRGGAIAASAHGSVKVPAFPVAVTDTVGAGDTFGAAMLAALVDRDALSPDALSPEAAPRLDATLLEAVVGYAVAASALTCTRTGAVPPSRAEIATLLASQRF